MQIGARYRSRHLFFLSYLSKVLPIAQSSCPPWSPQRNRPDRASLPKLIQIK